MSMDRNGQVITFYSFKGGTGRTMALANVAWILAERGMRVLVADWDLESPGLHRFFNPFLEAAAVRQHAGVIDMIRDFENQGINAEQPRQLPDKWEQHFANTQRFAFPIAYDFAEGGSIDFLSAGRQNQDYKPTVGALDWDVFYDRLAGEKLFDALRVDMKRNYDYTLIDSRTGLSDVADICTIHLPDILVDCFTLSEQGIDGAATVGLQVSQQYKNRRIRVLPVPMRVDIAEKDKAEAGRSHAMLRFAGLPTGLNETDRDRYWFDVEVPYLAWYAYEETLATFGDQSGAKSSLLTAYENIAAAVTDGKVTSMPRLDDALRVQWRDRFQRKRVVRTAEVMLRFTPRDEVWHEWIERLLAAAGVTVLDPAQAERAGRPPRSLVIVSSSYVEAGLPLPEGALAVYVDDTAPLPGLAADASVFLSGLSAKEAVDKVTGLLGRPAPDAGSNPGRYPGRGPDVTNAPVANVQFTGRAVTLSALRAALRQARPAAPSIAVLQGLGGVGKTQVALEYVHRFGAAYDLVYWINAEPKVLIDTAFADLGERMGLPRQQNVPLGNRAVKDALSRTTEYDRWLIVFDNVEEFADIEEFLPSGGHGHVIVTTRNQTWGESAATIAVDVFTRPESIAHLRRRVQGISEEEAGQIAELLGDLPIALAVGGAQLATSGTTPAQYRAQIAAGETEDVINAVWDVSLNQLEGDSPGAYRLLEICSVLAPDIALDLLNSNAMLELLRRTDATLLRRPSAAKLIQQLNRLALLKLDNSSRRIQVHRILQNVVRARMPLDRIESTQQEVLRVFAAVPPGDDVDNAITWDRYRMLWPHLEVEAGPEPSRSLFEMAVASDDQAVLELMVDRIRYIWVRGSSVQADGLAERILRAWRARLAAATTDPERELILVPLLRAQFNHANALRELGQVQEALALDTETLRQQTEVLGESAPDTLMTAGGLAGDLRALGRYGQALDRDRTTHATWSQEYGPDYPRTLAAQHNLASSLRLAGYFGLAREQDEDVVQRREVVLGRRTYFHLFSQGSLARDLRELGDYERSIALLNEVVSGFTEVRGAEAAVTLSARVNLAVSIRGTGGAAEAQPILDDCYRSLHRQFGTDNPDTLACRLSRATNLLSLTENDEARTETEAVREAYARLLAPKHPHTLVCDNNLAAIERAHGDLATALATAEAACTGLTDALHDQHPFLLAAQMNLAIIQHENGRVEEATVLANRIAELTEEVLGAKHPDALRARANATLMDPVAGTGPRAADPQVVADLAAALGESHPAVRALQEGRFLHRVLDPHPI